MRMPDLLLWAGVGHDGRYGLLREIREGQVVCGLSVVEHSHQPVVLLQPVLIPTKLAVEYDARLRRWADVVMDTRQR